MEQSSTYVINLLPSEADDALLTDLKHYFYSNDFKYVRKGIPSRPHLTIAKFSQPNDWASFVAELTQLLEQRGRITAKIDRIANEITKTQPYPEGEGWVALVFNDSDIQSLYYAIDELLGRHGINGNSSYINAIRAIKGDHLTTFDCIANHINLCNHCKPGKVTEATQYIEGKVPESITFDRIIIRRANTDEEDVRLELPLR